MKVLSGAGLCVRLLFISRQLMPTPPVDENHTRGDVDWLVLKGISGRIPFNTLLGIIIYRNKIQRSGGNLAKDDARRSHIVKKNVLREPVLLETIILLFLPFLYFCTVLTSFVVETHLAHICCSSSKSLDRLWEYTLVYTWQIKSKEVYIYINIKETSIVKNAFSRLT